MGDLQCPARVFLVDADHAAGWAERLRSERIAAVYAPSAEAQAAAAVAAALGLPAALVDAATPVDDDNAPALDPSSAAALTREALADIADRHRGEAVLLVDESGAWAAALRELLPGWAGRTAPGAGGVLALEADADGWRRVAAAEEERRQPPSG